MKAIFETDTYLCDKYRNYKHQRMIKIGEEILDDFVIERMKKTGDWKFNKNEIQELANKYSINVRDFMIYVLGKSEQLYNDLDKGRIQGCYSQNYRIKKEELIIDKRENFIREINPNIKNYYSWDDLKTIAANLNISTYDVVVNVMNKSRHTFYGISKNNSNGERITVGEYKSGPLPINYCKKNIEEILSILKIAIKSAIGYMSSNGYRCARYYQDLLQEGYIYLANKGNPIEQDNTFHICSSKYEESHAGILYKKAYFNAIGNIKEFCMKEDIGEAYDITIKTKGTRDEILEDEEMCLFINNLTEDDCERQILNYFSKNMFCEETIKEACEMFKVNSQCIQNLFSKLKDKVYTEGICLDDD